MSTTEKRVILCYALAVVLFSICILRIFAIIKDPKYFETAQTVSSRTVMLNYSRGSIFDTRNQRLTNGKNVIYAVIFGNPETVAVLYKYFSGPQIESITEEIGRQGFALRTVSEKIEEEGIYCFSAFSHADDSLLAKHIIGYTDSQGKGVCGIEAAFDEQLTGKGKNTITFTLDGHGKVLKGEEPRICYDYEKENSGVRLTLDASIQQLAEQEAMAIDVGAVIVSEVKTGKIRALVSRPDYRITDLSSALSKEGQPLLNRALCTYNIGSVFKPYVAAAVRSGLLSDGAEYTPDAPITGAEAAAILQNAMDLEVFAQDGRENPVVAVMNENGFFMEAESPLTRADAAKLLYRLSKTDTAGLAVYRNQ
jgi:penicillin-binding protein 2